MEVKIKTDSWTLNGSCLKITTREPRTEAKPEFTEDRDMLATESYPKEDTNKRKAPKRTWVYGILIVFVLWLVVANHVIVVIDDLSFVILQKTSWTLDGGFIGEGSWSAFTLHHPILMSRLTAGQGFWILGK